MEHPARDLGRLLAQAGAGGVTFTNVGATTVEPFAVIEISGGSTTHGSTVLEGQRPTTTLQPRYAINGRRKVEQGQTGTCYVGEADAQYTDAEEPEPQQGWGPLPNSQKLARWSYGFEVIGEPYTVQLRDEPEEEGGDAPEAVEYKLVRVRAVPFEPQGKPDSTIAYGASGTVSIYTGEFGSESDSGFDVTARNRFAAVAGGKWVQLARTKGEWHLGQKQC